MVSECHKCGEKIYFDEKWKSKNDKYIPLQVDTQKPHRCPKSNYKFIPNYKDASSKYRRSETKSREESSLAQVLKTLEKRDSERYKFRPKHTISDSVKYLKDKTKLGGLILHGMNTTGGTDIDWLIEHKGGFIVLENKEFYEDFISIPIGQMLALESLHTKLNSDDKCAFFVFGYDDIDYSDPDSIVYYFDIKEWKESKISHETDNAFKKYRVSRKEMKPVSLGGFRKLIEKYWKEFER